MSKNGLIILDRDGVLNKLLVRPDGYTDSPMNLQEIEIFNWVPDCLNAIHYMNYYMAIATNQPAAAKNKISKKDLCDIHSEIMRRIGNQYFIEEAICFHRSEDNCLCRKPKTALLQQIFHVYKNIDSKYSYYNSWMVGDRATDVIAGYKFGLHTALLGPSVESDKDILNKLNITPSYIGKDLRDFVHLLQTGKEYAT